MSIVALRPEALGSAVADVRRVYLDCYHLPSDAGAPFVAGLLERAEREGFQCCAACDDDDGAIVGFAYGFTGLPGQSWTDAMRAAVGPTVAREWLDRHFEFAEFAVLPTRQGRGIGGQLHDALFTGLRHRRAILTVRTRQQPARGLYERRGWQSLHSEFYGPGGRGPYCLMGLDLDSWRMRHPPLTPPG